MYFASFVLALVTYYHVNNVDNMHNDEMAQNTTVQISTPETLN